MSSLSMPPHAHTTTLNLRLDIVIFFSSSSWALTSLMRAGNKLLARLVSGINKPAGVTVLPPNHVEHFMSSVPIQSIPTLRGKGGKAVCQTLGNACPSAYVSSTSTTLKLRPAKVRRAVRKAGGKRNKWGAE